MTRPPDELASFPSGTRVEHVELSSGLTLRAYIRGDGVPAVLMHGFPELAVSWNNQLESLSNRYQVIALDMRGYGGSDIPREVSAYRLEQLARDPVELLDALSIDKAHITGHDWGGAVAWETATRFPERCLSLSVCNCPHPAIFVRHLLRPGQLRRSYYMFLFQVPGLAERFFSRDTAQTVKRVFRAAARNREPFDDEHLAPFVRQAERGLEGGLNYYRAALRGRFPRVAPVEVPTRLIWGVEDPALGLPLADPREYGFVRRFELCRVAGAGHWVQQEAPDVVSERLSSHWRANDPAS